MDLFWNVVWWISCWVSVIGEFRVVVSVGEWEARVIRWVSPLDDYGVYGVCK